MSQSTHTAVELNTKEDFENYNFREKLKKAQKPYDYYKEIKDLDFEQLADSDRIFLQDFGIYNNSLEDEDFMLRLRFNAGRIEKEQLRTIIEITSKFNLDIILTARAGMQLHGLEAHNILQAYELLKKNNVNTWQSFGDNIRNITTDIFDGIGKENIIETLPIIEQMQNYILKNPEYTGLLPRRISIGICGSKATGSSFFSSDLYFALAKKNDTYGFNVYMGGKNTELAQNANIFLQKEEIFPFFKAFIEIFNKYGLRLDRERNRLFHLIEEFGLDYLRKLLQKQYKKTFLEKGISLIEKIIHEDFVQLKNGTFSFCYHSNFAKITTKELENIYSFINENNYKLRIGTDQQLYIIGLESKEIKLEHYNNNRTIVACAGSIYCPYAYWSIKDEIQYLPLKEIEKNKILLGFSGCLRGCAKHEHSDIGLVGLKSNFLGKREKTARIYLGAQYTKGNSLARRVFNTIPLTSLKGFLLLIIKEFEKSSYSNFETFSLKILNNYSIEFLNLWFLWKFKTKKEVYFNNYKEEKLLMDNFKDINKTNMEEYIKTLSDELFIYKESIEDKKLKNTYIMSHN